jgi:NAD(P)-dependent dehydrogenase (short-subunit alcohol dehydrogenase family)
MTMDTHYTNKLFDLTGQMAVVTGGAGVICASLCKTLATAGGKVAILDINRQAAEELAASINQSDGEAIAVGCDVCDKENIAVAAQQIISTFGTVDILINGAGGNNSQATTSTALSFFDLPETALKWVIDLNLISAILSAQVFGKFMALQKKGIILNISSMNSLRPLTRIPAYSAAKAAVSNFTQWLAVHMAQEYSPEIRVNAIAPGFFLTDQNRYLLFDEATGKLTARGQMIIDHTPMKRFGTPEDLAGTVLWLLSPASTFVSGIVVPVDGGFSAFSGV